MRWVRLNPGDPAFAERGGQSAGGLAVEHLVLVLDDYHLIEAQAVHESLSYFLDHIPPNIHLVIATRSDPPLPLHRWRGRGQLTEILVSRISALPWRKLSFI